jgi:flagellar basal body-associated protein FliL
MSNQQKPKPRKGQLLTPIIILIMGMIMLPYGLLVQPYIIVAVMFGMALLALGIGSLYFYNKDAQKKTEVEDLK